MTAEDPDLRDDALQLAELQRVLVPVSTNQGHQRSGTFVPASMLRAGPGYQPLPGKPQVDPSVNCALWVSNLPPETQMHNIFQHLRTGAIFCVDIKAPGMGYQTAGADICFKNHAAAELFLLQTQSRDGVRVRGARIKAIWNTHGELSKSYPGKSLVLSAPMAANMSQDFWERYFKKSVCYQLSHFHLVPSQFEGQMTVEVGLARLDSRSQAVYKAIKEEPLFRGIYEVYYTPDLCDPRQHML